MPHSTAQIMYMILFVVMWEAVAFAWRRRYHAARCEAARGAAQDAALAAWSRTTTLLIVTYTGQLYEMTLEDIYHVSSSRKVWNHPITVMINPGASRA